MLRFAEEIHDFVTLLQHNSEGNMSAENVTKLAKTTFILLYGYNVERVDCMPMLHIRCKTCGVRFASGISTDKESFKTLTLEYNYHKCPRGHVNSYSKKDYSFKDSV